MKFSKVARALAIMACLGLLVPGAALSASFGEIAGGVKTMTEAGKDVNDIKQSNSNSGQTSAKKQKPAAEKQKAKKQAPRRQAPQNNDHVRGG